MKMKKIIGIIIILAAILASCTDEAEVQYNTPRPMNISVEEPPAFASHTNDTRADTNLIDGTVKWESGDQLHLYIDFFHRTTGKMPTQYAIASYNGGRWEAPNMKWPVADITHANIRAWFAPGANKPIYYGTATNVKPAETCLIKFGADAHKSTLINVGGMKSAAITINKAGLLTATFDPATEKLTTVAATTNLTGNTGTKEHLSFYVVTAKVTTQLTGTIAGKAFTIGIGREAATGKYFLVRAGAKPGTETPEGIAAVQRAEADRLLAWATGINNKTSGVEPNFSLRCNVDLSHINSWVPINDFAGVFNGNGYTISGLTISTGAMKGFFASLKSNAVLTNIHLVNVRFFAANYSTVGGLVAMVDGDEVTISNCSIENITVKDARYVGGLVGEGNNKLHMVNCQAINVDLVGSITIGGLIGNTHAADYNKGTVIVGCSSSGNITASDAHCKAGGLIGSSGGTIYYCYSSVNVTETTSDAYNVRTGGLLGSVTGEICSCYASGNTTNANATYDGSLVGESNHAVISYCNASGKTASYNLVGSTYTQPTACTTYAQSKTADIYATLTNTNVPNTMAGVRMWDNATGTVKTYTFTKAVWQSNLGIDVIKGRM